MQRIHALFAIAALGCTTAMASAGKVHITGGGYDFNMKSGALPGLFGNIEGNALTGSELRSIHESINAAGINTEGVVTFILGETSAGLTLFALVDSNVTEGPKNLEAMLGINTAINSANATYANNDSNFFANGGTFADDGSNQTLAGDMFWRPDGGATGMAWAGLSGGDFGSFDFSAFMDNEDGIPSTFAGLTETNTFQFISWTGTTWNLKRTGEFSDGSFSFSFAVVPVPPALAMGLAGLGAVAVVRRRRKKA